MPVKLVALEFVNLTANDLMKDAAYMAISKKPISMQEIGNLQRRINQLVRMKGWGELGASQSRAYKQALLEGMKRLKQKLIQYKNDPAKRLFFQQTEMNRIAETLESARKRSLRILNKRDVGKSMTSRLAWVETTPNGTQIKYIKRLDNLKRKLR
jgi:hypothetical protein